MTSSEKNVLVRICDCGAENAPQARKCKACGEDISDIIPERVSVTEKRPFAYELRSVDGSFSVSLDQVVTVILKKAVGGVTDKQAAEIQIGHRVSQYINPWMLPTSV